MVSIDMLNKVARKAKAVGMDIDAKSNWSLDPIGTLMGYSCTLTSYAEPNRYWVR